jgi:hypothetical protein
MSTPDKGSRRTYESPELKYEIGVVCTLPSIAGITSYKIVKFLLEKDIMPRGYIGHRATALPRAAQCGCTDIVKLLLATGFDVSATG